MRTSGVVALWVKSGKEGAEEGGETPRVSSQLSRTQPDARRQKPKPAGAVHQARTYIRDDGRHLRGPRRAERLLNPL